MNRDSLEALDKESLSRLVLAQAEAHERVVAGLTKQIEALTSRVADLEARLGLPPKTPDNSSLPPSKGQKPSAPSEPEPKAAPHTGAHRPLHPNPTSRREFHAERCQTCGADVTQAAQFVCETYDRRLRPR